MSHKFKISLFTDLKAQSVIVKTVDLHDCVEIHNNTWSPDKNSQPSWVPGLFGPDRSPAGCLRHGPNHTLSSGIMVDNDDGLALDEIEARLDACGLSYMQYPTASHGLPGKGNRSRVFLPFLKDHLPSEYGRFVSRVNGILGGILAKESWVPTTGWLYGNITGQPPCKAYISPGEELIDERDDLDAAAMPYQAPTGQAGATGIGGKPDFESMDETELSDAILSGDHGWTPAKFLIGLWVEEGIDEKDAVVNLEALFDAIPAANRRAKKWAQQRASIPKWVKRGYAFAAKRKSKPLSALVHHFEESPRYKGAVRQNSFARRIEVSDPFPPAAGQIQPGSNAPPVTFRALADPGDILETVIDVQADGFPKATKLQVFDALFVAASRHPVHPVRDYYEGLKWDGVARLNDLFLTHIPGAVPEDRVRRKRFLTYLEAIGPCFMIGAVARIFSPGCKLDNLVVLISPQGRNKSKALAAFVPDPSWFTDDIPADVGAKDSKLALDGKMICELAEFPHLRKEVDRLKAFLSRATDRYRPPYARLVADWPRQCVFIGTVNELILNDHTGNRRFWPVPVDGAVRDEDIARDRDQLWAEAVHRYRSGEKWWLTAKVEAIAREIQADFIEPDVRDESIRDWIDTKFKLGEDIKFTVRQVLEDALGFVIDPKDRLGDSTRPLATPAEEKRVARSLRKLGYGPEPQVEIGGKRYRYWARIPIGKDD